MPKQHKQKLSVRQVFAYRLRDVRQSKGWDQQRLADEVERLGVPMLRSTISKIERGRLGVGGDYGKRVGGKARQVSLEEAVAFAAALGVSPLSLLLPLTRQDDIQLAPDLTVDAETAYRWARGERPLGSEADAQAFYRFQSPARAFARPATLEDLRELGIDVAFQPKEDKS